MFLTPCVSVSHGPFLPLSHPLSVPLPCSPLSASLTPSLSWFPLRPLSFRLLPSPPMFHLCFSGPVPLPLFLTISHTHSPSVPHSFSFSLFSFLAPYMPLSAAPRFALRLCVNFCHPLRRPKGGGTELFRQLLSPRAGDSRPPIVGLCSLAPGAWPPCPIHVPGLQSRFSPRTPRLLLPGARIWISIVRGRTRFADLARKRAMPSPPCPGTPCFRAALGCLHPSGRAPRLPPTGRPALVCPTTSLRPPFRGRPSSRPATSPGSPPPASAGCL